MKAIAASSQRDQAGDAVLEVGSRLRALGFDNTEPAVALAFVSQHLAREPEALASSLHDVLGATPFVGFVGASAIHDVRLRERKAGLSVLVLPGLRGALRSAPLGPGASGDEEVAHQLLADAPVGDIRFLSVALDPASAGSTLSFLGQLDEQGVPIAGGLCLAPSGQVPSAVAPGITRGNVAAMLDVAGARVVLGVAQAARALGPTRTVTAVSNNIIETLDGRRAFDALVEDLPASLRPQVTELGASLCAGFSTEGGDATLIRNIVGMDKASGVVAVAARPRVGSELVFSLRDGRAARNDMDELLHSFKESLGQTVPRAFVLFSCIGRDEGLFGTPNFDAQSVLARFGTAIPVVGVASAGELCSYGTGTYLFGMSCVVVALL